MNKTSMAWETVLKPQVKHFQMAKIINIRARQKQQSDFADMYIVFTV